MRSEIGRRCLIQHRENEDEWIGSLVSEEEHCCLGPAGCQLKSQSGVCWDLLALSVAQCHRDAGDCGVFSMCWSALYEYLPGEGLSPLV